MTQSNFISYERHRYFKWAVVLGTICVLLYAFHTPELTPGLGTFGALLILLLLAFGLRKRAYRSDLGNLRGWLSAHVFFGILLALVATLHTGFEFGWNIHTLAYVLTMGVIISGLWGVGLYLRQPTLMGNLLDGRTLQDLGQDLRSFDDQCRVVAKDHPARFSHRSGAASPAATGAAPPRKCWRRWRARAPSSSTTANTAPRPRCRRSSSAASRSSSASVNLSACAPGPKCGCCCTYRCRWRCSWR